MPTFCVFIGLNSLQYRKALFIMLNYYKLSHAWSKPLKAECRIFNFVCCHFNLIRVTKKFSHTFLMFSQSYILYFCIAISRVWTILPLFYIPYSTLLAYCSENLPILQPGFTYSAQFSKEVSSTCWFFPNEEFRGRKLLGSSW